MRPSSTTGCRRSIRTEACRLRDTCLTRTTLARLLPCITTSPWLASVCRLITLVQLRSHQLSRRLTSLPQCRRPCLLTRRPRLIRPKCPLRKRRRRRSHESLLPMPHRPLFLLLRLPQHHFDHLFHGCPDQISTFPKDGLVPDEEENPWPRTVRRYCFLPSINWEAPRRSLLR
jgi:hypothetical protein